MSPARRKKQEVVAWHIRVPVTLDAAIRKAAAEGNRPLIREVISRLEVSFAKNGA